MRLKLLFSVLYIFSAYNIFSQVTADFMANTTSGCPNPLLIVVDDFSVSGSGVINYWSWTLTGPAGFSTITSNTNQISASLSIPGFYTLELTACVGGPGGTCDTKTETNYIEIFERPSYSYNISPLGGCVPQEVCFDGTIVAGCGAITSILFDSKDGVVYSTEDFCHTYANAGVYSDFTVSIQNSCGCVITETINDSISVVNTPIASFTTSQSFSCNPPLNVNFTNTSTASSSAVYSWNIPGLVVNNNSTNLTQSFGVGTYDVQFMATEPEGCSDTVSLINHIVVGNPNSDYTSNITSVCPGGSVQFTDMSNGSPTGWSWQVIGGSSSIAQNPSITFSTSGIFDVELTTTYPGGCQDSELKIGYITVFDEAVNDFTVTDSSSCLLPFNTFFSSTSTNSVSTSWSFPGGVPPIATGNGPINVSYIAYGNYNVLMYDTTSDGCVNQTTFNNVISVNQLSATIVGDSLQGCIPLTSGLSLQTNGVDPIVSYSWLLPGSNILNSILPNPTPTYSSVGCYDVSVDIVSQEGCTVTVANPNLICAGTPPVADFDFTPLSTCFEVEDICFTFTGSGADTVLWNFDDGLPIWTSPGTSPCHPYTSDIGTYSPSIIAYNYGCPSDTLVYTDSIEILGPVSVFTANFESCSQWNIFNFTNTSVEADSSYWIFGDPSVPAGMDTSTQENPSWTYPAYDTLNNYTVTLYVYNDSNICEHQSSSNIQVFENIASFTYSDSILCAPATVNFVNTSNYLGPSPFSSRWNWDSTYVFTGAPLNNVIWSSGFIRDRTYSIPGVYDVILRNVDSRGCLDTILKNNAITVHGITTGFISDIDEGCFPLSVNFTDTSFAPLTYVDSWHWDFGTGIPADTSILQNPSFTYSSPGNYTVTLTATDSFGCVNVASYNNFIYVHDPFASFSLSDTFICNNQTVTLNNQSTGDSLSYDWQFQNANIAGYNTNGNPPNVTFNTEGYNIIYLEVTDNFNCTDDTTFLLPVFDVIASGIASEDTSFCPNPPLLVQFTNTSINNVDSNSVMWDFGNGITSTDYNPSTLYSFPGEFVVTLSVSSLTGCSDISIIDTIIVEGPWGEFDLLDSSKICNCDSVSFAITTINATMPVFLTGDGQAIPFSPSGVLGDTIRDTLKLEYCSIGDFTPSLSFSEGSCSYNVSPVPIVVISVDSLITNFNFSSQIFCDTGTVCFSDSSYNQLAGIGEVDSWNWDFGDGNISNVQNPCHFYSAPGSYYVCLDAGNLNDCSRTFCDTVLIRSNPNVNFGMSDTAVCLDEEILFYDSTIVSNGANIISWQWGFGTGNILDTAQTQNPSFTYTSALNASITLNIEDDFGCTTADTSNVTVFAKPIISSSNDTIICLGDTAQLFASGASVYEWIYSYNISDTSINNPIVYPYVDTAYFVKGTDINGCSNWDSVSVDISVLEADFVSSFACANDSVFFSDSSTSSIGLINNWAWNFDDLSSGADNNSILQNPVHIFNMSGNYNVNLIVENMLGCIDDTTIQVNISTPPTAIIDFDSACANTAIDFSSLMSLDGSGTIVNTHWDFGTGNAIDTSNLAMDSFIYTIPGLYTVCLTVTSDLTCIGNMDDTCVQVMVYALPQVSEIIDSVCLGNESVMDDTSLPGDGNIISHHWDFGQNASDTALIFSMNGDTSFQYNTSGIFSVLHTVVDDLGCEATSFKSAIVLENPLANFEFNSGCEGDTIIFSDSSSTTFGNIDTWGWNFDDLLSGVNDTSVIQNPVHQYIISGNYDVSLAIVTDFGCIDDTTIQVNISVPPTAIIEFDSACANTAIDFSSLLSLDGTGTIVNTHWDFGTGIAIDTSNLAIDSFTYSTPGLYTVCLTVTSDLTCAGNMDDTCVQVLVYALPQASEIVDSVCIGAINTFDDNSINGDGNIIAHYWNFGTGNPMDTVLIISNNGDTAFQYNSPGIYNVVHIVADDIGCIDTSFSQPMVLQNPIANFGYTSGCAGDTIMFSDSSSALFGNVITWGWNFDDLLSGINDTSVIQNPEHQYLLSGNYDVSLAIETDFGCINDTTIQISISVPPTAIIEFDSACANTLIDFSSLMSLDGSGTIINTQWDFGTGNIADTSNLVAPSFAYSSPGLYTVCLTVTSDLACVGNMDDTCVQVLIYALPQAREMIDTVCLSTSNSFDDNSTNGDGNIIANYWNFGQDPSDTVLIFSNNGDTAFQYNTFGLYNVIHIVADDLGCIDTSYNQATVFDNPSASFTFTSACLGENNTFTSTSIAGLDGINTINDYDWDFDEGASFINGLAIENYSFNNTGNHNVSLAISDNFGCLDTVTQVINLLLNPVANFVISSNEICLGDQINLDATGATFATPGVQYYWDENYNTGIDNNTVNYNISPSTNTQIMFVIEDDNNCSDTSFTNIKVHQNPNANFTFGNGCVNLPIDLNSTSTEGDTALSTFNWLINGFAGIVGENTTFVSPTASNITAQLVVEDLYGCLDTSSISSIQIDTTVFIDIDVNDTVLCAPTDLLLDATGGTAQTYLWTPQSIIDDPSSDMISATINGSVTISVTGSSITNSCPKASDTLTVLLAPEPNIEYTVETNPIFVGLTTDIDLEILPFNNSTDSVSWDASFPLNIFDGLNVEATPTEETDFPFSVFYFFNGVTCQLDSFVNIQILDECSDELIYAPNVFTPNKDRKNDIFRISGISLDYLNFLRVFDRWGKLVFERENVKFRGGRMKPEDSWHGMTPSGNPASSGVYVIMYEGVCKNGESVIGSGNVTLIR